MFVKTARTALLSTVFLAAVSAAPAFAHGHGGWGFFQPPRPAPHSVPEIDAGSGLAAAAALIGALALAWERRRAA